MEQLRQSDPNKPRYIGVGMGDNDQYCECDECSAIREREGSDTGVVVNFVNGVAEQVETEFPDARFVVLAYWTTLKPPRTIKPRDNVIMWVCTMARNHAKPVADNAMIAGYVKKWSEIGKNFIFWDYSANFRNFIMPHPNIDQIGKNIHFFAQQGASGGFVQSEHCTAGNFAYLRNWLESHMLWDPSRDDQALIAEFMQGYYGPAAPYLQAYRDVLKKAVRREGIFLSCYMRGTRSWLRPADVRDATDIFEKAERAVANDPVISKRLRRLRMSLDLVWLIRYNTLRQYFHEKKWIFNGPSDPYKALQRFKEAGKEFRVESYKEWRPVDKLIEDFEKRYAGPASVPEKCKGLCRVIDWLDIQDNMFELADSDMTEIVDDPQASDGKAARIKNNFRHPRAVEFNIDAEYEGKWHCYVAIRCQSNQKRNPAFKAGIYDLKYVGEISRLVGTFNPAIDKGYKTYYLGEHYLRDGAQLWVQPEIDKLDEAIFVDRFFLVRAK